MIAETSRTDLQAYADLWAARLGVIRIASISDQTWIIDRHRIFAESAP